MSEFLSKEEEYSLIARWHDEHSEEAYQKIEKNFEQMMYSVISPFAGKSDSNYEDLFQVARMGLVSAIEKFDPGRGTRLSTTAMWWIRQAVYREIETNGASIRIPSGRLQKLRRFRKAERALEQRLCRMPSDEELAAETGLTLKAVRRARQDLFIRYTPSLDSARPANNDDEVVTPMNFVKSDGTAEDAVLSGEFKEGWDELKMGLTPLRRTVADCLEQGMAISEIADKVQHPVEHITSICGDIGRELRRLGMAA